MSVYVNVWMGCIFIHECLCKCLGGGVNARMEGTYSNVCLEMSAWVRNINLFGCVCKCQSGLMDL